MQFESQVGRMVRQNGGIVSVRTKKIVWWIMLVLWCWGAAKGLSLTVQRELREDKLIRIEERQKQHLARDAHAGAEKRLDALESSQMAMAEKIEGMAASITRVDKAVDRVADDVDDVGAKLELGLLGIYTILGGLVLFVGKWLFTRVADGTVPAPGGGQHGQGD